MLDRREINCNFVNRNIPLFRILESIGYDPVKKRGKYYIYHSPFRVDKDPSFYVDINNNVYTDFGDSSKSRDNLGFTVIDFIKKLYNISTKEALQKALSFSFSPYKPNFSEPEVELKVVEIKNLTHPALINYLRDTRKVDLGIASKFCKEIHYLNVAKKFFGIGFKNDSGGYELRNSIDKRTIAPKDITFLKYEGNGCKLVVLEGFMDFLSFFSTPFYQKDADFLVLNGNGMIYRAKEIMINYPTVELYLDTDTGGDTGTGLIQGLGLSRCIDMRPKYAGHKDLNEYCISRSLQQRRPIIPSIQNDVPKRRGMEL